MKKKEEEEDDEEGKKKVSFYKGLTLASRVEESFRGYLGHT